MTTDTQSDAFGQRLMALFEAVIELDAAAQDARIAEVARTEPALADAVRALLARDAETGALRAHLSAEVEPLLREALPSLPSDPQTIGPYAVLRRLGEGGMGRVYLARRSDSPVAQNVAIKLIRSDRVSPGLLDRFEAERRHLAALDHPGICRFIDAASLADGTPYVVMEAVEGVPIIDYCAQRELGVEARLKLLRKLLAAVAHAHDRLLVHRDIKPHNVLVTADGEPKLLDFGIAKSIEAEHASQTRTAERFFTPNASAPEQLLGGAFGVGCDVYALGALAYELLSGHLPFDFDGLRAAEIERLILQVAPPLMSERAPTARARDLRGDLDAIVATCLRKSPAERYANVSALDTDLGRYLEGRPVEARAPTWIYRAKLFVRRHRVSVALSGALALAILGSAATLAVQAFELREQRNLALVERDRALQVVEILESAFRSADPGRTAGDKVTARQILDAATPKIETIRTTQPALYARLGATLAKVELDLGNTLRSTRLIEAALESVENDSAAHEELLVLGVLAFSRTGDLEKAHAYLNRLNQFPPKPSALLSLARGRLSATRSDHEETLRATAEGLALDTKELSDPTELIANELRWLRAVALRESGDTNAALSYLNEILNWQEKALSTGHPYILRTQHHILRSRFASTPPEDLALPAANLLSDTIDVHGNDSAETATTRVLVGFVLLKMGDAGGSLKQMREALSAMMISRGPKHIDTVRLRLTLAHQLRSDKALPAPEEAVALLMEAHAICREMFRPWGPITMASQNSLVSALGSRDDWVLALDVLDDAFENDLSDLRKL
jgi:tetratricopeptide (TPR) repeat protein